MVTGKTGEKLGVNEKNDMRERLREASKPHHYLFGKRMKPMQSAISREYNESIHYFLFSRSIPVMLLPVTRKGSAVMVEFFCLLQDQMAQ